MQAVKAIVRNGRLVVNEPTDRPEGEVVELVPLDEVLAGGSDYLDVEERAALLKLQLVDAPEALDDEARAALHAKLREGMEAARAGRTVSVEALKSKLLPRP